MDSSLELQGWMKSADALILVQWDSFQASDLHDC